LWTKVAVGIAREIRVPAGAGIVGAALRSNALIHVPDPYADPRFNPEPDRASGFRTRSLLTSPMADVDGKPVGVIQAVNKKGERFLDSDLPLIRLLADQAGVAIQRYRLEQAALAGAELHREMTLAHTVQMGMIPRQPPCIAGLTCAGYTKPASITGGDAFDLWVLSDGRLGVFLGDASGHGIAPALVVSQARTLLRALCEINADPAELITRINGRLSQDLTDGRFVTMFVAMVADDGTIHWTSGGHGPILLQRSPDGPVEQLLPPGTMVGWIDPYPLEPVPPLRLERGGRLIVLSDGIFEAFAPSGEKLEVAPVVDLVQRSSAGPRELITEIQQLVRQWQQGDDPKDDQTAVIVQRL
jgi:phosphoserine phosphatase